MEKAFKSVRAGKGSSVTQPVLTESLKHREAEKRLEHPTGCQSRDSIPAVFSLFNYTGLDK